MKDAGLRIRVQRELREQFLEICRAQDKPAAQVLREFMRQYVQHHEVPRPYDAGKPAGHATTSALRKRAREIPHG